MRKRTMRALALLGAVLLLGMQFQNESKAGEQKVALAATKVPSKLLSERDLDRLLAKSPWPKQLHAAVKRIAFCESSWIPTAKDHTDSHGLMQVRFKVHFAKVTNVSTLYDPLVNLRVAHDVWAEAKRGKFKHGFAPWYASNKCHGLVPKHVALAIERFKAKSFTLANAR